MTNPLICEVTRGTMVESVHRVHAMVFDGTEMVEVWGKPDLMCYPRSSIKFAQALPLIESGAADACAASVKELALACASHSGAPEHVTGVAAWLERLGLGADDLACGPHLPYDDEAAHAMIRRGEVPTRLHNNCSGKHTGFLATARHLGEEIAGYLDIDHPVQRRLAEILVDFGGEELGDTGRGVDGCGIPTYGMSIAALARLAQRLAAPVGVSEARGRAIERILAAVTREPYLVAGRGRFDYDVMKALGGAAATKTGAEGVHIAIVPGKRLGVALKAEDGQKRAADVAMGWILQKLGVIGPDAESKLAQHLRPIVLNAAGDHVGEIRIREP